MVGEWKLQSIEMLDEQRLVKGTESDILKFSEEGNVFSYSIESEDIIRSGIWSLSDSLLTLVYNLPDTIAHIDSMVYRVLEHVPGIEFWSRGLMLAKYEGSELLTRELIDRFEIVRCDEEILVFENGNRKFTCAAYDKEVVLAGSADSGFGVRSLLRGLIGLIVILGLAFLFSTNRRAISWRLVGFGLLTQITIAFLVLKVPVMQNIFEFLGKVFVKILNFSNIGGDFLFESFITGQVEIALINFAFQSLCNFERVLVTCQCFLWHIGKHK